MSTETTTTEVPAEVTTTTTTDQSTSSTNTTPAETPSTTTSSEVLSTETPTETPAEVVTETPAEVTAATDEEYDLELPEGSNVTEEQLNAFAEHAGKLGLKKEDAEALLGLLDKGVSDGMAKTKTQYEQEIQTSRAELLKAPEFSGEAAKASWESVGMAIATFGDESFEKAMLKDGIGDNLAIARFLKKIGDAMREDGTAPAKGIQLKTEKQESQEKSKALRMYPEFKDAE